VLTLSLVKGISFPGPTHAQTPATSDPARLAAQVHCTACHALPDPSHLDRHTWTNELIPKMRIMVGLGPPTPEAGFLDIPLLIQGRAFPEKPLMTEEQFNLACRYFVDRAPDKLASIQDPSQITVGLKGFEPEVLADRHSPPLSAMVRIDPPRRRLLLSDVTFQGYNVISPDLAIREGVRLGNIPVAAAFSPDADWFACIGHFFPREEPRGQLIRMRRQPDGQYQRTEILSGLPRTTDVKLADLNGDGREDFTLCLFGNYIGRFSWFEGKGEDRWVEHVLWDKPGALRCEIVDLDGDGHLDLVVLFAQHLETLLVFQGDGRGGFIRRTLNQRPPSWGHSGFELADFNGDGRLDVLVTNGDNADFQTSPPRPHHGVRILLNRGNWHFEEAWFAPMNGAYRAVARDFDLDGDLDIAAVSFFPDYQGSPREGFILFENSGSRDPLRFTSSTFRQSVAGRWLTLDAGDLDGDGDEDLVLGSLIRMPTAVPEPVRDMWEKKGPSVVILRNKAK
jgi:hypothetical protein